MPTKYQIALYWSVRSYDFVPDINSPQCFACCYDGLTAWGDGVSAQAKWTQAPLERCHIIAASIDGEDTVDNLVLLCRDCHLEAPMTNDPRIMLDWMENRQNWLSWAMAKLLSLAQEMKFIPEQFSEEAFSSYLKTHRVDRHPDATARQRLNAYLPAIRHFLLEHCSETCIGL